MGLSTAQIEEYVKKLFNKASADWAMWRNFVVVRIEDNWPNVYSLPLEEIELYFKNKKPSRMFKSFKKKGK